jgi:hypothetical protein
MAKPARTGQPQWSVCSVAVRVRDGPDRVRAAYRLLLDGGSFSADGAARADVPSSELVDAGGDLHTRIDRAPGT